MSRATLALLAALVWIPASKVSAEPVLPEPTLAAPFQAVDLNVGDSQEVTLAGQKIQIKLLDLKEQRDSARRPW